MKYFMYHVMLYKDTIHHTLLRTFRNKEHLIDFLAFHQDIKGKYLDRDLHKIIYYNKLLLKRIYIRRRNRLCYRHPQLV